MGLFSRKTADAESMDSSAARAYEIGLKLGGKAGGRVADAVSNTVLGPSRRRDDHACTRKNCTH